MCYWLHPIALVTSFFFPPHPVISCDVRSSSSMSYVAMLWRQSGIQLHCLGNTWTGTAILRGEWSGFREPSAGLQWFHCKPCAQSSFNWVSHISVLVTSVWDSSPDLFFIEHLGAPYFQPRTIYQYRYSLNSELNYLSSLSLQGSQFQAEALVHVHLLWRNTKDVGEQLLQVQVSDVSILFCICFVLWKDVGILLLIGMQISSAMFSLLYFCQLSDFCRHKQQNQQLGLVLLFSVE